MADSSRGLVFAAFGLSVVAVGLAALSIAGGPSPGGAASSAGLPDDGRLTALEEHVARLAARGAREPGRVRNGAAAETPDAPVAERLAALESTVAELAEDLADTEAKVDQVAERGSGNPLAAIQKATPTPEQIDALRALVLDTESEPRPRLLALRELARVPDGRTLEIARSMKALFESTEDEWTRSAVVGLLEGFVDPELEPWLVDTLRSDRFSSTRESATDTLSYYTGSEAVRQALRDAVENDKNYDVRADAQNALDKIDEREGN